MTFNWKEYLDLARYLQGKSHVGYSEESARRASVSRAYYAAFCFARNYAHDVYGRDKKRSPNEHAELVRFYAVLGAANPDFSDVADNLNDLRQWRNFCDYDDDILQDIDELARVALDSAQEIINSLK